MLQIYSAKAETRIDRPAQELRTFYKTGLLAPGEEETISLSLPISELSYWDENASGWTLEKGLYTIKVGTSSRDIKGTAEIEVL